MRFGALSYTNTENLGDEVQSLAAMRFLPKVDCFIDRDGLAEFESDGAESVSVILNGWYGHRPESWPPSRAIRPLLVAMHLSPLPGRHSRLSAPRFFLQEPAARYLRENGPVGARDLYTLELLQKHGIPAYFSGCLTLTLKPTPGRQRGDDIVVNDVPEAVLTRLRKSTGRNIIHTTHADPLTPTGEERFDKARRLLALYETAHCVITTRLHCVLPCLALGTPVLYLEVGQEPTRLTGLSSLFRSSTLTDFVEGRCDFDVERPTPNAEDFRTLSNALERTVASFIEAPPEAREAMPAVRAGAPEQLRFQTLLSLYTQQAGQVDTLTADLQARTGERDQLQASLGAMTAERDQLRAERDQLQAATRTQAEKLEQLRQEVAARQEETEQYRTHLEKLAASHAWRAAMVLKAAAGRLPAVARGARFVLDMAGPRLRRVARRHLDVDGEAAAER